MAYGALERMEIDVKGVDQLIAWLNSIADEAPKIFEEGFRLQCKNLQKSLASTVRNYKITKTSIQTPRFKEAAWNGMAFAKKRRETKILQFGTKNPLTDPHRISIMKLSNTKFSIGWVGGLADLVMTFQEGVPATIRAEHGNSSLRWVFAVLNRGGMKVDTVEKLAAIIQPVSVPRPFMAPLAEKLQETFPYSLKSAIEVVIEQKRKKAGIK